MPDFKMTEIKEEEFVVLCAPDGSPQFQTLAPDFVVCISMMQVMAEAGIGQHPVELFKKGFRILPVKLSAIQNGN